MISSAQYEPRAREAITSGLTDAEIDHAETRIGVPIQSQPCALYKLTNGPHRPEPVQVSDSFPDYYGFYQLPMDEATNQIALFRKEMGVIVVFLPIRIGGEVR